jgi:PAS domain S-box-containing protein
VQPVANDPDREAEERRAILSRAGAIFAESLDLETTLRAVARLCVGPFADYCLIDLVDDGRLVRAAAESVPELDFTIERVAQFVPAPDARAHPIARAWREGTTQHVSDLAESVIDAFATSPEHRAFLVRAAIRSVVSVPITAHGRTLGVLSLGMTRRRGACYDARHISDIEELARDAGTAIANAQLYRELARSEARYRQIIETTREGVMIVGPQGRVQYANPQFALMLGYAIDELYDLHYNDLLHPDERAAANARFIERKAGDVAAVECRFRHRDGSDVWTLAAANPVFDEAGFVATLSMHTDITQRKQMETMLAQIADDYRSLAEATPQVVWTAEPDGRFDYLNERWVAFTGIPHERSLEWGWTAALHPDDLATALGVWRASRETGSDLDLTVRLRRADGMYRWHLGRARALIRDGAVGRWFGTFTDIHEQRTKERQLALIAQTTELLADTLDREHLIERLCRFLVSELAEFVFVDLFDEGGALITAGTAHRDEALAARLRAAMHGKATSRPESARAALQAFAQMPPAAFASSLSIDAIVAHARPEYADLLREAASGPFVCAPVVGHGRTIGLIGIFGAAGTAFDPGDVIVFTEIAARFALALQNAELYAREQHVATTLQRALLPQSLPVYPGVTLDAIYTPGTTEAQIGGDWYDAYPLADGRLAVTIGDVTGRGLQAATIMGRVRQSLEALATYQSDPAELLNAVDAVLRRAHPDAIVTALVGVIDLRRRSFAYATAGHPTPFVRSGEDGTIVALPGYGLPLGLRDGAQPPTSTIVLPPNATILLYTDGLVESTRDIDEGERRLLQILRDPATTAAEHPAHVIRNAVLFDGSSDDVAVFTIGIGEGTPEALRAGESTLRTDWSMHWAFDSRDARVARDVRELFVAYLRAKGSGDADYAAAELVFGELIGNVARHAPGLVEVEVEWRGNAPVLHVLDRGPGYERTEHLPPSESESGRGLFLISKLTREFTVTRLPGYGSHARAVLPIERGTTAVAIRT